MNPPLLDTDLHRAAPQHGWAGLTGSGAAAVFRPASVTAAVAREAGSRGGTVAAAVAKRLGWQLFQQEVLEYLSHERHLSEELFEALEKDAVAWVEARLVLLGAEQDFARHPELLELARIILAIGAKGEAVIVGRGAGFLLPTASTLHVRVVAPVPDRVAYMAQMERLPREQAAATVAERDQRRAAFVKRQFGADVDDVHLYDLLVNSSRLGEEAAVNVIARATELKQAQWAKQGQAIPRVLAEAGLSPR